MDNYGMDKLLSKVESRFELVIAAAKRARQINDYRSSKNRESLGQMPDLEVLIKGNPLTTAMRDIADDKIKITRTTEGTK